MGFKLRPGTSVFGNVTFDPELGNRSPVLSGIDSSYVLTQDQDLIISGLATDPDGDDITWSHSLTSGDLSGTSVSQSGNVFTITPGEQSTTFEIQFIATDSEGSSTSIVSSFEYTYSIGDVMFINTEAGQPFSLAHESPNVILHHDIHANTNRSFSQIWTNLGSGYAGIRSSTLGLNDGIPNSHYSFVNNLVQLTLLQDPYANGTTIKFVNNDLYMTQNLSSSGWRQFWNFIGDQDTSSYANFVDFINYDMTNWYFAKGNSYGSVNFSGFNVSSNGGWHTHKIQFKSNGYNYYIDDNLVRTNNYVSPGSTWRFVLFSSRGEIKKVEMYGLQVFVDGED